MSFLRAVCVAFFALSFAISPMHAQASTPVKKVAPKAAAPVKKAQPVKKPPTTAKAANLKTPAKKPSPKPAAKPAAQKALVKKPATAAKPAASKTQAKPAAKPAAQKAPVKKPATAAKPAASKTQAKPAAKPAAQKAPVKKPATAKPTPKPVPPSPKLSSSKTTTPAKKTVTNAPAKKPATTQSRPQASKVVTKKKTTVTSAKKPVHPNNDKLIILDAGHGGYDVGARVSACNEKSLALSTTLLTKKILSDMGYRVILTRSRDIFIPLQKRTTIANQTKSKLFVSIHFNSAKNTQAKGIEVFYYNSKDKWRSGSSKKLARIVLSKMIAKTGAHDRGVKNGNFHVIRETKMPAILVEGGFITHEGERHNLVDVKYREKIARGIAEGIHNYFKA